MYDTSWTYRAGTTADSRSIQGRMERSTGVLSSYDMVRHLTMFPRKEWHDQLAHWRIWQWTQESSEYMLADFGSQFRSITYISSGMPICSRVNWSLTPRWSQSFTHALLNLATYPQYCTPLREEASIVINEDGWTKTAMTKLVKMDSFLKESQRFNSTTLCKLFIFDDTKLISASPYDAQSNAAIRILGWYRDTQWNTCRCCFIAHASRRGILWKRFWVPTFPVLTAARGRWRRLTNPAGFHKCKLHPFWVWTSRLVR